MRIRSSMHKKAAGGRFLAYQLINRLRWNGVFVQKVGTDMLPPIVEILVARSSATRCSGTRIGLSCRIERRAV